MTENTEQNHRAAAAARRTAYENRPFAMLEKLLMEAVARWGEYDNQVNHNLSAPGEDQHVPYVRVPRNIRFDSVDRLRMCIQEVAKMFVSAEDDTENARLLNALEEMVGDGHVAFCFELDGGVHGSYEPAGGDRQIVRSKDNVGEVIEALARGEGVTADPQTGTGSLILEPRDLDILTRIHHNHANALQFLQTVNTFDADRLQYWTEQFEHFRGFYSRARRSATPQQIAAVMPAAHSEDAEEAGGHHWATRVRTAREALNPYLSAAPEGKRSTLAGYHEASIVSVVAAAFDGWTPPV